MIVPFQIERGMLRRYPEGAARNRLDQLGILAPVATAGEDAVFRFSQAVTARDAESAVALCHPDVVFRSVIGISGHAYLGHDGVRKYFEDVDQAWQEWSVDVERVAEASDGRVVIVMMMHARGRHSGALLEVQTAHIWTLSDGQLLWNEPFRDGAEALRAAGLV